LYVLLRGVKRFRLFSPDEAESMYTRGEIALVHENGRICYRDAPARADGAPLSADVELQAQEERDKALAEVELAEQAVAARPADKVAKKRLKEANKAFDAAMDALLS
ncbi:MAG: hypothetical protein ACK55Z_14730, partial [bacterium]